MSFAKKVEMVFVLTLGLASAAWAQRMGRGMGQAPNIPGTFKPVVGSGAQYEIDAKNQKMEWTYVVVGKESVDGGDGYWMEMRTDAGGKGEMVMKHLMVIGPGKAEIKRMIMQSAGQPPMEMPMGMMQGMMKNKPPAPSSGKGPHEMGEKVGTETVTVPAGTFLCEHYRSQTEKGSADMWVSTNVSPYGLVKMTSADTTMVLQKVLSNETSHIKGEPQKMNFEMPHF
jgi:hypothetical protein